MEKKYKDQTLIVFTSESSTTLMNQQGSGDWTANIATLSKAEYLICVHNDKNRSHHIDSDIGIERGQAFFIGKIKGIETLDNGRKFIQISEYSILPNLHIFKDAWKKLTIGGKAEKAQQNPIKYEDTKYILNFFNIELEDINWNKCNTEECISNLANNLVSVSLPDLIDEARKKISEAARVTPEKVLIKIEF